MTKKDLEALILVQEPELNADVVKIVTDLIFDKVKNKLSNGIEVSIPNFGKFKIVEHAERMAKNPLTGEAVEVKAKRGVRFANSKTVKDTLNEGDEIVATTKKRKTVDGQTVIETTTKTIEKKAVA